MKTPGSLSTAGYDKITSLEQGKDDHEVIAKFSEVYAPYKNLFANLFKAAAVKQASEGIRNWGEHPPEITIPRSDVFRPARDYRCGLVAFPSYTPEAGPGNSSLRGPVSFATWSPVSLSTQ